MAALSPAAPVAKKKTDVSNDRGRDRIDMRVDPEWELEVRLHAKKMGMALAAYLRFAATQQMLRDKAEWDRLKSGRGS